MTYTGGDYLAKSEPARLAVGDPSPFWTAERSAQLTLLWQGGLSAGKIAKQMGCGRNQVIGKAHRLKLVKRASPIVYADRPTHQHVRALQEWHCRYPHGHPGEPGFRFCGRQRSAESPYCPEHERVTRLAGTSYYAMERLRKQQARKAA